MLAITAFLALGVTSAMMMVVERQWSGLAAHAVLTSAIALFFYPSPANGEPVRDARWSARRAPVGRAILRRMVGGRPGGDAALWVVLPTSMARLYRLRVGDEGTVEFFSDFERLRELERRRAVAPPSEGASAT